jgi:hypothetical protein
MAGGDTDAPLADVLVLTEDRRYGYIRGANEQEGGRQCSHTAPPGKQRGAGGAAADVLIPSVPAFEAAFGALTSAGGGVVSADADAARGDNQGDGRLRWRALFDTPSHVLPPPTSLAPAYLFCLVQQLQSE